MGRIYAGASLARSPLGWAAGLHSLLELLSTEDASVSREVHARMHRLKCISTLII